MANIFISYNRESENVVRILADDMEALGHSVWFDQELSGGHAWWGKILETIRNCDVFVFALSPAALESVACNREYHYAAVLGKPILPVQIGEGISTNLLPPLLSQLQFVDYRQQDREAALRLGRALTNIPPPQPLPDPLPTPPAVPISYLGGITEQIETAASLSYEQQGALLLDLKRGLRNPDTTDDARTLLEKLRHRRDIMFAIAEEIDELLASTPKAKTATQSGSTRKPVANDAVMPATAMPPPSPKPVRGGDMPDQGRNWTPILAGLGGLVAVLAAVAFFQMPPSDLPASPVSQPDAAAEAQRRAEAITRKAEEEAQRKLEAANQQAAEVARKAAEEAQRKLADAQLQARDEELKRREAQLKLAEQQAKANPSAPVAPPAVSSSSATSLWYQVNAKPSLRIRSSSSETAAVVGSVPDGGRIKVLRTVSATTTAGGRNGQWMEVEYQGKTGYAFSAFLTPLSDWRRVTAQPHLNVRSAPDVTGKVIVAVKNGETVKVLERVSSFQSVGGESGYWVKIEAQGKTGFVFDAYLER